jgi:hypothetical protein
MTIPTLPARARFMIVVAVACIAGQAATLLFSHKTDMYQLVVAFFISAFLADLITALFHFGFDYVFPYALPVLGPIAREFNEHHDAPTLDPRNWVENLTKGSYASFLISLAAFALAPVLSSGAGAHLIRATLLDLAIWTLFFHQMHSYAHMGSSLSPEVFHQTIVEISRLPSKRLQRRRLKALFETVPIPPAIRLLQRVGLTLDPVRHNLHHVQFESDFSSVNGWSDPILNPLLGPLARLYKARRLADA